MFDPSSSHQISTINFRLKSAAATTLSVQFLGRDIKVCELKEKIAERLLAPSGANLQLFESGSNKLYSDPNERVAAYSEILVVRTNEVQPGGMMGGMGSGAAPREKLAGALGTMTAAKKAAAEMAALTRKAELDFGAQQPHPQHHLHHHHHHTSSQYSSFSSNAAGQQRGGGGVGSGVGKTEEEKLLELQDIVGRDMGIGSATYGGRGGGYGGRGGRGGGGFTGTASDYNNPLNFAAGRSVTAGGSAMQAAPSLRYICHLCGQQGHYIEHCPLAQGGGFGGRGGGGVGYGVNASAAAGVGGQPAIPQQHHHARRFAQPTGIPESELERCNPEDAMFITRDGHYVKRKLMGLGGSELLSCSNNDLTAVISASAASSLNQHPSSSNAASATIPIIKCMHCQKTYNNDVKQFLKLPCNCDAGRIACRKCVDDGICLEMSDEGPVCAKCKKEIDADEIVAAKVEDFPTSKNIGQRRDRD